MAASDDIFKLSSNVYNQYRKTDFAVGADNLNPLREVSSEILQDLESFQDQMYERYKAKIQDFLNKQATFSSSTDESLVSTPGDLGLPYDNRTKLNLNLQLWEGQGANNSSDGSLIREIANRSGYSATNDSTTGMNGVYDAASSADNQALLDNTANLDGLSPAEILALDLMKILDAFLGGVPIGLDDLPIDICGDRSAVSGGEGGTSSTGNAGAGGTGSNAASGNIGGAGSILNIPGVGSIEMGGSDMNCIMVELEFLKVLFAILTILKKIIMIERKVLSKIYPIIDFIVKIIEAIFNPSKRARLILDLAGQVLAIVISWLFDFISKLLGNLDLECLASTSIATFRQIMGAVAGVKDVGSEFNSLIEFNKSQYKKIAKITATTWKTIKEGTGKDADKKAIEALQQQAPTINLNTVKDYFVGRFTVF